MCGSVVRLGVMSYLGEMNGFRVPRPLVCNTLGEMNGLGLHVTSVGRDPLVCEGPSGALGGQSTQAVYKLWALCRDHPSAAFPGARDEAPLRLVSWLSFRLSQKCHEFIQTAMDELCSDRRVDLLSLGQSTFPNEQLPHLEGMKEFLLSEVALAGMAAPPVLEMPM